jgi:hypothetical protein
MILRTLHPIATDLFKQYPVLTITGPRQSGKTTLAKAAFDLPYANLEAPDIREFAQSDPRGFLAGFQGGAILDEIQRAPQLPSYLQAMVDELGINSCFVLTGSQNFSVREALSQSLAGRNALLTLLPLSLDELNLSTSSMEKTKKSKSANSSIKTPTVNINSGNNNSKTNNAFLYRGFYPRVYDQNLNPSTFYRDYIATYVERDLRQLSLVKDIGQFQTFMRLCASHIGQVLNLSRLANDCSISQTTATEWLNLLEASYIVTRLPPYFTNTRKRLVKRPKLYFYDPGVAAFLLGILEEKHVDSHPLKGALFENLVLVEVIKYFLHHNQSADFYFYRDSDGNEVDLLVIRGQEVLPIEIKYGKTINRDFFKAFTRMQVLFDPLPPTKLVVYGGEEQQHHSDGCRVIGIHALSQVLQQFSEL